MISTVNVEINPNNNNQTRPNITKKTTKSDIYIALFTYSKTNGFENNVNDKIIVIAFRHVVTVTQIKAPYSLINVRTISIPK